MQKGIRRRLTGKSKTFWHKIDLVTKEVEAWPAWKRESELERRGTASSGTAVSRQRSGTGVRSKPRR